MKALKISAVILFILLLLSFIALPNELNQENSKEENFHIIEFYKPHQNEILFKTRHEINEKNQSINNIELMTFYSQYTNNWIISQEIIKRSIENEVPIHISFAIAWHESRFNPQAISQPNRDGSRDWGLFQLNDSYRNWTQNHFFDIKLNTEEGIRYYKWCYDQTGNIISALQAYNAGLSRVLANRAPSSTLRYVDSVLNYESMLDEEWNEVFNKGE